MIRASHTDVVVAFVDVFLVLLAADQMRCVTLAFREHFNIIDFHRVFVVFVVAPRKNVTATVVDVVFYNARKIAVVNFTLKHQQGLSKSKTNNHQRLTILGRELTMLSCKVSMLLKKLGCVIISLTSSFWSLPNLIIKSAGLLLCTTKKKRHQDENQWNPI